MAIDGAVLTVKAVGAGRRDSRFAKDFERLSTALIGPSLRGATSRLLYILRELSLQDRLRLAIPSGPGSELDG